MEYWKRYKKTNNYISESGNILTLSKTGKHIFRKPCETKKGYFKLRLAGEYEYVHRLVAKLFIEPVKSKNNINHKDLNKKNNHYSNLEWCTVHENNDHAQNNGVGTLSIPYVVITKSGQFIGEFKSQNAAFKYKKGKKLLILIEKSNYNPEFIKNILNKPRKKFEGFIKATNRLLSDAQVLEIKELFLNPEYYDYRIANMYGVNSGTIRCIREGKGYSDVIKK